MNWPNETDFSQFHWKTQQLIYNRVTIKDGARKCSESAIPARRTMPARDIASACPPDVKMLRYITLRNIKVSFWLLTLPVSSDF